MKNRKVIAIILIIITTFIMNFTTVRAKAIEEYVCEYKKVVKKSGTDPDNKYYAKASFYSGYSNASSQTEVTSYSNKDNFKPTYIYNLKSDVEIAIREKALTLDTKIKTDKWIDKIDYNNPKCPQYLIYITGYSGVASKSFAFAADTLDGYKGNYQYKIENKTKNYTVLENTKLEVKRTTAKGTDLICQESLNQVHQYYRSKYQSLCIYTTSDAKEQVLLYISSADTRLKPGAGSTLSYADYEETPDYSKYKQSISLNPLNKKEYIGNSIAGRETCPIYIYKASKTQSVTNNQGKDESVTFTKYGMGSTPAGNGFKVEKTYQLMPENPKRNPETCEVQSLTETELPENPTIPVTCENLIDENLKKQINRILTYVRILVPILIIVLGIIDFAQAILASKEEEMKKAQSRFIRRLIIGIVIFLLPTIINLLLDLANYAWRGMKFSGSDCGL